jgi:hypothetical protein
MNQKHIPYRRWSREEIIDAIKGRINQKVSVQEGNPALRGAAWRMFGTWKKACQSAKVNPALLRPERKPKWTQEKILIALRECYRQSSDSPSSSSRYSRLNYLWILGREYFPSVNIARKELGLPLVHIHHWNAEKVIKYLQDRFRRGKPINTMALLKENRFLYRATRTYFGSFQSALRAAGFDFQTIRSHNKPWHFRKVNPATPKGLRSGMHLKKT